MDKQKVISAIYNLKSSIEILEENLYTIKVKDPKHNRHLYTAKSQAAIIAALIRVELLNLKDELERDRYKELSDQGNEKFLKINSPSAEAKTNIQKILDIKQRLVTHAAKSKKTNNIK